MSEICVVDQVPEVSDQTRTRRGPGELVRTVLANPGLWVRSTVQYPHSVAAYYRKRYPEFQVLVRNGDVYVRTS